MHGFSHLFRRPASRGLQRPSAQHQLRARESVALRSSRMVSSFLQPWWETYSTGRDGEFESSQEYEYLKYHFHGMTVLPAPVVYQVHLPSLRETILGSKTEATKDRGHRDGSARRLSYRSPSAAHGNVGRRRITRTQPKIHSGISRQI